MLKILQGNARIFFVLSFGFGVCVLVLMGEVQPWNLNQGYAPEQPIAFSHRLHAGDLKMECLYCHYGARTSPRAGIPPTGVCMRCHTTVSSSFDVLVQERELALKEKREPKRIVSQEIAKLYEAMGLDTELKPKGSSPKPLPWVKVHNLPDFVAFDHSVHVSRGLACESCHGPVQSMERMRQENDLSMGWCIDCHRSRAADPSVILKEPHGRLPAGEHVSTDCAVCHY